MYDGFMKLGGVEILNRARAAAYLKAFLPQVEVVCNDSGMRTALGHPSYVSPAGDGAPWYKSQRTATHHFYGLFPGKVLGSEDSKRTVQVTELSGNGAILTSPRYTSAEIRFVATAFAKDEEAMMEGMAWLRDALSNDGCSEKDIGCTGQPMGLFAALPTTTAAATNFARTFHNVEITEGPLVTKKFPTKGFVMWEVEFTATAGVPWAFTSLADIGTLDLDAASNFQDPAGENCSVTNNAYNDFIADPYFTAISRPPRPPVILPPNILNITSWRRLTLPIPTVHTQRWGRVAPVVSIVTEGTDAQYLRVRFYRASAGLSGCDFDGEFIVSYLPANSVLTLNSITREATIRVGGRTLPAGHLLFGSGGRPFTWPSLGCQHNYTMTADLMPGQPGVAVVLQTAARE